MHKLKVAVPHGHPSEPSSPSLAGYEVFHETSPAPLRGAITASVTDEIFVFLSLQDSGFVEWARSAAYDTLWGYLTARFAERRRKKPQFASLRIYDPSSRLRALVEMPVLGPKSLANAQIMLKHRIERNAEGTIIFVAPPLPGDDSD